MSTENVRTYLYCYSMPSHCSLMMKLAIIHNFLWYSHVTQFSLILANFYLVKCFGEIIYAKWMINVTWYLQWTKMLNMTKKVLRRNLRLWNHSHDALLLAILGQNATMKPRNIVWIINGFFYLCYAINMDLIHSLQSLQLCKYSFNITNLSFLRYGTYIDWNVVKYESQLKVL